MNYVDRLRESAPLVQCLTNTVVAQFSANALLAAGASPAMVDTPEEAAEFAGIASGVLVNLGTPTAAIYLAIREAVRGARTAGTPWVLDPVACGGPTARSSFAADIVTHGPAAVRGNPSEIRALSALVRAHNGAATSVPVSIPAGRGVDSTDDVDSAVDAAAILAAATGAVVAVSGPRDLIVSVSNGSTRVSRIRCGDPMMQRVVGTGCALGALTAAYLGSLASSTRDADQSEEVNARHDAVLAAHAHAGAAGSAAAQTTSAPGSFAVEWLNSLFSLSSQDIAASVTLENA